MAKQLEFFDLKKKKKFKTSDYTVKTMKTKNGKRKMAVAKAPSGAKASRFVSSDFKK